MGGSHFFTGRWGAGSEKKNGRGLDDFKEVLMEGGHVFLRFTPQTLKKIRDPLYYRYDFLIDFIFFRPVYIYTLKIVI